MTICVTSINQPDDKFLKYKDIYKESKIFWIGDRNSISFETEAVENTTLGDQLALTDLKLPKLLPKNHYSRKNVGYLLSISEEGVWMLDTDDDNFPICPYDFFPSFDYTGDVLSRSNGRVNIYRYFTQKNIWPRGLGYQFQEAMPSLENKTLSVAVWQGLVDLDPDVDAVYRLAGLGAVSFDKRAPVVLDKNLYCPFNSQNTFWHKNFITYAYLPSTVTFRYTDILRSYIAQKCLWAHEQHIGFCSPNVYQLRNEHNLLKDLESELEMYKTIDSLLSVLDSLSLGSDKSENLLIVYEQLLRKDIVKPAELDLLEAWLDDIKKIGRDADVVTQ